MLDKHEVRKLALKARKTMSKGECIQKSEAIMQTLVHTPFFNSAKTIGLYASYLNEVDTYGLINYCLKYKKQVALPKVEGNDLTFYRIHSLDDLKVGAFHLLEPQTTIQVDTMDLLIVPLIAFNENRDRIGYGKGFYDRFLNQKSLFCVGLAYESQKYSFDRQSHDYPLNRIISEKRIY